MVSTLLVTLAAKLPQSTRDDFVALAKARNATPSALLRSLVERELAGGADGEHPGEVETAVLAELADRGVDVTSARASVAVNLARRMDRVPTAGAPNAQQLRLLLEELVPAGVTSFDQLSWIRLSRQFRQRGWQLVDRDGATFSLLEVGEIDRNQIVAVVSL